MAHETYTIMYRTKQYVQEGHKNSMSKGRTALNIIGV